MRTQPLKHCCKYGIGRACFISISFLLICASGLHAQAVEQTTEPVYPFRGHVNKPDVFIRSGPGTNFYSCGKFSQGDVVQVLDQEKGWLKIVPPPGSFSWIAMKYVAMNMNDPSLAVVTGDNVSIYAGSNLIEPMHSTSKQTPLKRGTRVKLFNEEKDGYVKIEPPVGSYLWVSSNYVQPIVEPVPDDLPSVEMVAIADANVLLPEQAVVVPSQPEPEISKQLKAFNSLREKTQEELTKPLSDQDYEPIRTELLVMAADPNAGDVARYAEFLLTRIERYELAQHVSKAVAEQDKDLADVRSKLNAARSQRNASVQNLGRYAVIGLFTESNIYNSAQVRRYRILGEQGKTVCYAEPAMSLLEKDLRAYIGKKVGLVGKIKPFPAVNGALVLFTEIQEVP